MARKSGGKRSDETRGGSQRRGRPAVSRRTIKRDQDTSQLLERGEGPTAEEQVDIREILTHDPELDATDIEVEVERGAVTLSGVVDGSDAKLLAEELVESLPGVREVHNRLRVERGKD
jgi:osmotically-inducible protein OsmY